MKTAIAISIIGGMLFAFSPVIGRETAVQRWAIIASKPVVDNGLADLVTVSVSQNQTVELIERTEILAVTRELELSTLQGDGKSEQRLRLGKLIGADRLLLLSTEIRAGQQVLRVVVCETRNGVRLRSENLLFNGNELESLASRISAIVSDVQIQFAHGIRQIMAVPPFLSLDFEHRFDDLQSKWAELLISSLMLQRGVAVVEVDEVRSIMRERQQSAGSDFDRQVAFIVQGKYRTQRLQDNGHWKVNLSIEIDSGNRNRLVEHSDVVERVGPWLVTHLTPDLLTTDDNGPPLSLREQKRLFTVRAQDFAELGNWKCSTALREAIVVIDPNDALQRGTLIHEYQHIFSSEVKRSCQEHKSSPERQRSFDRAATYYELSLQHLEYLVRNRLIGREDAAELFRKQKWYLHNNMPGRRHDFQRIAYFDQVTSFQRAFVCKVFPLLIDLTPGRVLPDAISKPQYGEQSWMDSLFEHVFADVELHYRDPKSLLHFKEVLTQVLPSKSATCSVGISFFSSPYNRFFYSYDLNDQGSLHRAAEWVAFLEELSRSEHELARVYGRLGLLKENARPSGPQKTIERTDALLAELTRLDRGREPVTEYLKSIKQTMQLQLTPSKPSAERNIGIESLGRLRFQPIPLVTWDNAKLQMSAEFPVIRKVLQCGNRLDLYWSDVEPFVMETKGVLRRLQLTGFREREPRMMCFAWDGEFIWLFAEGQGIIVIRPDGSRVAAFDPELMPSVEGGLMLLGLSPRKTLAVGCFGPQHRTWFAMLEVNATGIPSARVFFEAKNVTQTRSWEAADADPKTGFQPQWIHRFHDRDGKDCVLVGRAWIADALLVDLETLQVSFVRYNTRGWGVSRGFFSRNGHLLQISGPATFHFFPRDSAGNVAEQRMFENGTVYQRSCFHDGWVHVPGFQWRRIHPVTFQIEDLIPYPGVMPLPYRDFVFDVSAHYGLIGLRQYVPPNESDSPTFFQITIDDEPGQKSAEPAK